MLEASENSEYISYGVFNKILGERYPELSVWAEKRNATYTTIVFKLPDFTKTEV